MQAVCIIFTLRIERNHWEVLLQLKESIHCGNYLDIHRIIQTQKRETLDRTTDVAGNPAILRIWNKLFISPSSVQSLAQWPSPSADRIGQLCDCLWRHCHPPLQSSAFLSSITLPIGIRWDISITYSHTPPTSVWARWGSLGVSRPNPHK